MRKQIGGHWPTFSLAIDPLAVLEASRTPPGELKRKASQVGSIP
jgi:hypothetical protein